MARRSARRRGWRRKRWVTLALAVYDRLRAMRAGESYSDVIIRAARLTERSEAQQGHISIKGTRATDLEFQM